MKIEDIFFWKGAHTYHRITYHIVFTPKYRKRILRGPLCVRIRELLFECASVNRWFVHEMEVMEDHVHLLIQLPANIAVSEAVKQMKGGSARVLRKEFPELEEFLWGDSIWQDGYFVETVGRLDEKIVHEYIQTQKQ